MVDNYQEKLVEQRDAWARILERNPTNQAAIGIMGELDEKIRRLNDPTGRTGGLKSTKDDVQQKTQDLQDQRSGWLNILNRRPMHKGTIGKLASINADIARDQAHQCSAAEEQAQAQVQAQNAESKAAEEQAQANAEEGNEADEEPQAAERQALETGDGHPASPEAAALSESEFQGFSDDPSSSDDDCELSPLEGEEKA